MRWTDLLRCSEFVLERLSTRILALLKLCKLLAVDHVVSFGKAAFCLFRCQLRRAGPDETQAVDLAIGTIDASTEEALDRA